MRALAVAIVVLAAGCSGPEPVGPEAPLAGPPHVEPKGTGEVFNLEDSGTMMHGIDETWSFDLPPNATNILIQISAVPIEDCMQLQNLEAQARQDGEVVASTTTGIQGSFGGAQPRHLVEIQERLDDDGNLTSYAGAWELSLRGEHQLADFAIKVRIDY